MSAYTILRFIHVLLAIVAVGTNATYGVWMALGAREPQSLRTILRGIRVLDSRIANPAYGLLLVTGLAMLYAGNLRVTTPWILSAIVLYVVASALGLRGYSAALRTQIKALDSEGPQSATYRRAADRGRTVGLVFIMLVLIIVLFMVTKPALWG